MIANLTSAQLSLFDTQPLAAATRNGAAPSAADKIVSAVNGGSTSSQDDSRPASQVGSIAFDSIFSVNHVDANEMKIDLMERIGERFGLDMASFDDGASFGRAVSEATAQLDPRAMEEISRELGLDDLGVTLRDVIDAMDNPGGDSDRKVVDALREKANETPTSSADPRKMDARFDDNGLYEPASQLR